MKVGLMPKYRKKPVVVDAWRWLFNESQEPTPDWMDSAACVGFRRSGGIAFEPEHKDGPRMCISTLEGVMVARPGDYIIRGVAGELSACEHSIFEQTYEAAE